MKMTNAMLREYGLVEMTKEIEELISSEIPFCVDFAEGYVNATPYDYCTDYEYSIEQGNQLMFHDYESILSYIYQLIIECKWHYLEIISDNDIYGSEPLLIA